MKSKTKFDPKVLQQFFIDHTEKFVLGLVAVLFAFFVYASCTLPAYKRNPEELKSATAAAVAKMADGPATKTAENEAKVVSYADIVNRARTTIDASAYPMPPRLNWTPIPPRRLRSAPEVYAVEQLRAVPGRGAISKSEEGSNSVGKRWIVVTGLVPYKKQLAEYRAKFEGAAWNDPAEDVPKYLGYFVQRAEVVPGAKPKWSRFTIFPSGDAGGTIAKMGGQAAEEIADPRLVVRALTAPLFQLADGAWGSEAVSPPQIPIVEHKAGSGDAAAAGSAPVGAASPVGGQPNAIAGAAAGVDPGAGGILPPDADQKPGTDKTGPKEEEAQVPEYLLLRFFDFDVKPDKQYQYRIFLVLTNPNSELSANVLDEQDLAAPRLLGVLTPKPVKNANGDIDWPTTPKYWSSPCISGRVPGDIRLLGGAVVAAKGPQEINAEVRILRWLELSGLSGSYHQAGLIRGTILNFPGARIRTPGRSSNTQDDLMTNCILVDVAGGDPLPGKERPNPASPGVILVMDEFGNLVMHDEVAESDEWDKATEQPEKREAPKGAEPEAGPAPAPAAATRSKAADSGKIDSDEIETNAAKPKRPGH